MISSPYTKFAEVYDELMNQQEFYESYFGFIYEVIGNSNPTILDLGCGTGKLAKLFKDNGYDVEGLDISGSMLKIAKSRDIKVYRQSMVDFRIKKQYGLIVSTFDSLNYLRTEAGLRSCFSSVHHHLSENGFFIFDLNSGYKINSIVRLFGQITNYAVGTTGVAWRNSQLPGKWIAELTFLENGKEFRERHVERAFKLAAVKKLLQQSGFEILKTVSDFDSSPIKKNSPKWFFVCRKR